MENIMKKNRLEKEQFSQGEGYVVPSNKELDSLVKPWKCDAIIHIISGTIIGGGPSVKYWGVENALRKIADEGNIRYTLVSKSPIGDSLSKRTIAPDVQVFPSQSDWTYLYKFWDKLTKNIIEETSRSGYKNIMVFSEGYTAFVPLGIQNTFNSLPLENTPNIRLITRDSSLPDLPDNQWGGRFNSNAYKSSVRNDKLLESYFITNSGVPGAYEAYSKAEVKVRIPKKSIVIDTAFPFSNKDAQLISDADKWYDKELINCSDNNLREILMKISEGFVPISWLTNGEIFDFEANWMTKKQKESSYKALRKLVISASQLSEKKDQKILLILPNESIQFAQQYLKSYQRIKNLDVSTYPSRSPNLTRKTVIAFDYLIGKKGLLVGRTAQTNAFYQVLLMPEVKACILTTPAKNYMNTTFTDPLLKNYGIEVESADSLASEIYKMIEKSLVNPIKSPIGKLIKNNSFDECIAILSGINTGKIN